LLCLGRLRALPLRVRRLGELLLEIGQDRLLAVDRLGAGDQDRNRPAPGRRRELRALIVFDGDLMDGVGEAELGQALAHPVRRRTPFRLPELERGC
jgi:hypothetical protein